MAWHLSDSGPYRYWTSKKFAFKISFKTSSSAIPEGWHDETSSLLCAYNVITHSWGKKNVWINFWKSSSIPIATDKKLMTYTVRQSNKWNVSVYEKDWIRERTRLEGLVLVLKGSEGQLK